MDINEYRKELFVYYNNQLTRKAKESLNRRWLRKQRKRYGNITWSPHLQCPLCLQHKLYAFPDIKAYKCKECGAEIRYRTKEAGLITWEEVKCPLR